jgi:long-chain fatty acid transport protein
VTLKKIAILALIVLTAAVTPVLANGLNLNSLGTRALSMGGAFVGLADDFSCVYWNPAGLAKFTRQTFGFSGSDIIPSGRYTMSAGGMTLVDAQTATKHYLGGLAAYIYPVSSSVVVSLGVYTPSGLGASWKSADLANLSGGSEAMDWTSKVGLITFAPSIAFKVSETLSLGLAFNINYGMFDLSMYGGATPVDLGQYEESETGWGMGATVGVLFQPAKCLSLGATLRTSSTVKFSGQASLVNLRYLGYNESSDMEREVTWPMWIAFGAAFHPIEDLTLTADIQWTQWSKIDSINTIYKDVIWNYIMTTTGKNKMAMEWKDATQIRVGAEYRLSKSLALRAGFYNDPSPAPDKTISILLPSYDFTVLTVGVGYEIKGLALDFALEYLMGKERTSAAADASMPGVYNMTIVTPSVAIRYSF